MSRRRDGGAYPEGTYATMFSSLLGRVSMFGSVFAALSLVAVGCAVEEPGDPSLAAEPETGTTAQALTTKSGYLDIAYGKTATASSTAYGGSPSRAVDGNTSGTWSASSVTHTNQETNPWWKVELSGSRPVSSVTVTNRSDCCTERLAGAIVELLKADGTVAATKTLAGAPVPASQEVSFGGTYGSSVRVRLEGASRILSLAEVEVWMAVPAATAEVEEGICWKETYGRGVGTPLSECASGKEKNGLLCYSQCQAGYKGVGPVCWETCPAGYTDDGAFCRKDAHITSADNSSCPWYDKCGLTFSKGCSTCPSGYSNDGCTCRKDVHIFAKKSYGRGAGSPMSCAAGKQEDAGLCYSQCSSDYKGVGPVCWGKCSGDYPVECGAACATSSQACAEGIVDMAQTTIEAVANITSMVLSFGQSAVAVSAARTVAKTALTATAKAAIKAEVKKQLKKQAQDLIESELESLAGGLADSVETGEFDWTVLDPTGIAAVVNAFNQPICE